MGLETTEIPEQIPKEEVIKGIQDSPETHLGRFHPERPLGALTPSEKKALTDILTTDYE
jgi:hypothetical protein